ncbi:DUF4331 domain-containing protein [Frankia sp. CNm7]|uniref:DUF4331 domain-containing protein n=1 Tax=Frankia nepalensis TaxID=1836974 RepID=A0A937USP8_9ACTN|nr:DUF4331 domain-containing protein [Frankia nepalensis]MBL7500486.1 DUF4331 domain-containing protein [Frankia nepalensis]MBL7511234.1 DUF4331 domain-containing protein [Frankia nepalensis]MBL7523213.1 DUF4331 domain-containing protein [Frankia nepalensis]MBL7632338.1 DUF4331 domain-containing protein [Frankia nepalensis]
MHRHPVVRPEADAPEPRTRPQPRRRRRGATAVTALVLGAAAAVAGTPLAGNASSHREAPLIAGDPTVDNTDTYAFVSPDAPDTVTLVANWSPFSEPAGGPNFFPFATDARYNLHVDADGDAKADLTYRWTFTSNYKNQNTFLYNTNQVTALDDPDLNFTQTYKLELVRGLQTTVLADNVPVAPSNVGVASMPDYPKLRADAVRTLPGGLKSFAGQADDPFFLDLRVFDLLYGGNASEIGQDTLRGYNVNSIVLQVPKQELALNKDPARNPVIGVWSTTDRRSLRLLPGTGGDGQPLNSGGWSQVSRLGSPLVNEVVLPVGQKDRFNNSNPDRDAQFLRYVTNPELPKLIQAIYNIPAPAEPRNDLVAAFLTGVSKANLGVDLNAHTLNQDARKDKIIPYEGLRLNMSIAPTMTPNRLGVVGGDTAGFPNGRRLTDDVVDIELQAVQGVLLPNPPPAAKALGDAVDANDVHFQHMFPYVALPTPGSR